MRHNAIRTVTALPALVAALAAAPAAASLPADEETSYGYLRTVEGPARIVQSASGAAIDSEANYPILAGDRLEVDPGGRLEVSLPDFNVVRLDGGSELELARLALSAETDDVDTALRLLRGEIQVLVRDLLPVAERPRVDTANATIYLQATGVYRIATDGYGWTELVVRRGFAEIATEAGSSVVRGGEQAWIEGGRWPRVDIARAGALDELERWGADLDGELAVYGETPVDDHLAYSAAPLARHGSWVTEDGYRAWRPAVATGWRPYESGYWADSPTGMVWVSYEPWGWVTYHYGSWVPSVRYGWVWRPGRQFAPAWVYWYWGPSHVAWVPVGYYSSHYRYYGRGFRYGIHGWAGGSWSYFADWTFCSTRSYRQRDLRRHIRRGDRLARDTRSLTVERGLITTDSRHEARRWAVQRSRGDRDGLPDVTPFVAQRRDLPPAVAERVFSERRAVAREEVWERPEGARSSTARGRASLRAGDRPGDPGDGVSRITTSRSRFPRADAPAGETPSADSALPRAGTREPLDSWRRPSGRLRSGDTPAAPSAAPRTRPGTPTRPTGDSGRWWENRTNRAAPRGATPSRPESSAPRAVPGDPGSSADERPPVVRRVWEGIRDRQRAAPSPRGSAPPATRSGSPPPGARTDSETPSRAPEARPRATPSRRPPAAEPRSEPSRRAPAARGSSESSQRSSGARSSSRPSPKPPAASDSGGSSGRRSTSSASSSSGSSSRRGTARRRPPA